MDPGCVKLTDHELLHNPFFPPGFPDPVKRPASPKTRIGGQTTRISGYRQRALQIEPSKNPGNRLYDGQRRPDGPH
jgi:hypothetical protein